MTRSQRIIGIVCSLVIVGSLSALYVLTTPQIATVEGAAIPSAQEWLTQQIDKDKLPPAPHHVFDADFTDEESDPTVYVKGDGVCISELNPQGLHIRDEAQITVKSRKSRFAVNGRTEFSVRKHAIITMGDGSKIELNGYCRVTVSDTGKLSLDGGDESSAKVSGAVNLISRGIKLTATNSKKVVVESGYATLTNCASVEVSSKGAAYCQDCPNVSIKDEGRATVINAHSVTCRDKSIVEVYGNPSISARGECKVTRYKTK